MRMRKALVAVQLGARRAIAAISNEVGRDELFLGVGLGLLGYGLWLTPWSPAAFIVPGAALVWMALPPRKPFVVTPAKGEDRRG